MVLAAASNKQSNADHIQMMAAAERDRNGVRRMASAICIGIDDRIATASRWLSRRVWMKRTSGRNAIKPKKSCDIRKPTTAPWLKARLTACRCSKDGAFLDVNHVLVAMLGYDSSMRSLSPGSFCERRHPDPGQAGLIAGTVSSNRASRTPRNGLEPQGRDDAEMSVSADAKCAARRVHSMGTESSLRMSPTSVLWRTSSGNEPPAMV